MPVNSPSVPRSAFGRALRQVRKAKKISQENFDASSSRTYISALERGIKQPTLTKVDGLAAVLQIHPLTLLALAYTDGEDEQSLEQLVGTVLDQARAISAGLAQNESSA